MNPNDDYFDGMYQGIWKSIIPADLTSKEAAFMSSYFALSTNSSVIDIMCGYGRHSIALAQSGVKVCAIDNLKSYTDEIRTSANKLNLPIEVVTANVINYKFVEGYDLAICMGNSLNFFPKQDVMSLLKNISDSTRKGGHILINTWSLLEIVAKDFNKKSWSEIDGIKFLADSRFEFHPTRVETNTLMISSDHKTEEKLAIDYVYSLNEIEDFLQVAGYAVIDVFSVPGKKKFSYGDPRAYIVGEKR